MDIHRLRDVEEARQQAGKRLEQLLKKYERQDVLFLSSAGSSLSILEHVDIADARQLTISVLDERFSADKDINNFSQLSKTSFFIDAVSKGANVLQTIPQEGEDLEQFGDRFERQLRNWRLAHKNGMIVATIGMGTDGHIAGIFPYPELPEMFKDSFMSENWTHAYSAVGKHEIEDRVTVTIPFLCSHITHAIAYIVGQEKQDAIVRAMEDEGSLAQTPARVLQTMKDVYLFTDL